MFFVLLVNTRKDRGISCDDEDDDDDDDDDDGEEEDV